MENALQRNDQVKKNLFKTITGMIQKKKKKCIETQTQTNKQTIFNRIEMSTYWFTIAIVDLKYAHFSTFLLLLSFHLKCYQFDHMNHMM